MDLKARGGSALSVMRYSILLRFARAKIVIRSLDTVGRVHHEQIHRHVRYLWTHGTSSTSHR